MKPSPADFPGSRSWNEKPSPADLPGSGPQKDPGRLPGDWNAPAPAVPLPGTPGNPPVYGSSNAPDFWRDDQRAMLTAMEMELETPGTGREYWWTYRRLIGQNP